MPPRLRLPSSQHVVRRATHRSPYICPQCRLYASIATTSAPPINQPIEAAPPIARFPTTKPPSHKPPEFRKSQLHRQYQSLLRSCPLTVIFQHNNLKATEWMGVRRELAKAMAKVDEKMTADGKSNDALIGDHAKIVVVQTGIFASALRVVEFWNPQFDASPLSPPPTIGSTDPASASSETLSNLRNDKSDPNFTHGLSTTAWLTSRKIHKRRSHGLEPLLTGPLALLTLPSVSTEHLAAALRILSPSPAFPAPRRRENPAYHEPAVQNGLHKLMLLGARVEGKVFDLEGTRWVGGIEGGLDGLRGQLVAMLQSAGVGLTRTLEGASRSLWMTVEGRREMLEKDGKGESEGR